MNLWIRLLWLFATARARGQLFLPVDASVLAFRVWPHDLDLSLHMNNGRYLTLMDLGRLDVLARSGLWAAIMRHKWTPIASAITIRYRRELRPFRRFRLSTRLVYWDETNVVMEQTFAIVGGKRDGQIAAHALFKGGLYDRAAKKFVPMSRLMDEIGARGVSPEPSPEVAAFLASDEELKKAPGGRAEV